MDIQRYIKDPLKHLRWSALQVANYFCKMLHLRHLEWSRILLCIACNKDLRFDLYFSFCHTCPLLQNLNMRNLCQRNPSAYEYVNFRCKLNKLNHKNHNINKVIILPSLVAIGIMVLEMLYPGELLKYHLDVMPLGI